MKNVLSASLTTLLIMASLIAAPCPATAQRLSESLQAVIDKDTVRNVWVFFKDRPAEHGGDAGRLSDKTALRRRRAGFKSEEKDSPVSRRYIAEIERRGGAHRATFRWENAASFSVHASRLSEIASLPFVDSVAPVAVYIRKNADDDGAPASLGRRLSRQPTWTEYGYGWHLETVNIPFAHEYIKARGLGEPGSGVLMAFFDSGFRLDHRAFNRVTANGSITAVYDFVDRDTTLFDPDSVVSDITHENYQGDSHGTSVLGIVAGHHSGVYMGAAWGANFALARTENVALETRTEEDYWAEAVEWAEELGADIISSSLGYRDGHTDPLEDYSYRDMNGTTTIISRAAAAAAARGVIVVSAIGNGGSGSNGTLWAPADAVGVISVGGIDINRNITLGTSTGPTADGRIKPEVVAPGQSVPVVDAYGVQANAYKNLNGTSFAAPIVSGILALMLQANPNISPEEAKERLYRACAFAPRQTFRDNRHGYGIPNATRAIMREDEIFIKIVDSLGVELVGAQVKVGDNAYNVDSTGNVLIAATGLALPLEIKVLFRDRDIGSVMVDSLPFASVVSMNATRESGLKLSPTVVKRSGAIKGKYLFSGLDVSAPAIASVFTLNGKKVWEQNLRVLPDGTAEFVWNGRDGGRKIPAGVYFVTVKHGYNMISERIMIRD